MFTFFPENMRGTEHVAGLNINRRIELKFILRKYAMVIYSLLN